MPREQERLPSVFSIYSDDCVCPFMVEAECRTQADVWSGTELVTAATVAQGHNESRGQFKARLHWLQGQ